MTERQGFAMPMERIFMSVICATRRETRLLFSPATRMIRDAANDHPGRAFNVICDSNQSCSWHQC